MGIGLLVLTTLLSAAPKFDWLPVSPDELAETSSPTNPGTPAEILYRRIESDQSLAPFGSTVHEYLRYKIYDPEKSDAYTRISRFDRSGLMGSSMDQQIDISARLTLPDGTIRFFTKDDIKERPIQKTAADSSLLGRLFGTDNSVTEKFLAVTGIVSGSVLEYQIVDEVSVDSSIPDYVLDLSKAFFPGATTSYVLQHPDLSVRRVEFFGIFAKDKTIPSQYFTLNRTIGNATSTVDRKQGTMLITATDLPPAYREPLSGPGSYYSLSVLQCLTNSESTRLARQGRRLNVKVSIKSDGPWSAIAAMAYVQWEDSSEVTGKVKKLAGEITDGAKTDSEKARLIHGYVQDAYQEFRRRPKPKGVAVTVKKMDDIISREKTPNLQLASTDFLFLANALYRASGFETRGMLFPDRSRYPFSPALVVKSMMPNWAVSVKINDAWEYSMPQSEQPLPFGSLPWFCERANGLVIKAGPQELIDSPPGKSAEARIINSAELILETDGTLSGNVKRTYTGHHAYVIRTLVKDRTGKALISYFQRNLANDFKAVTQTAATSGSGSTESEDIERMEAEGGSPTVVIKNINGLTNSDGPVEVEYSLHLSGYGKILAGQLIFHPSVFRSTDKHPFSASERHNPVQLPFAWQEIDRLTLTYPEAYAVEKTDAPSLPSGPLLHYKNILSDDPASHTLTYRREFATELIYIPADKYELYKAWNDEVLRSDQYQLVLARKTAP